MATQQEALQAALTANNLLGEHRDALADLMGQLQTVVDWTNTQGRVRDSATLYKLIQDLDYLVKIGPGLVERVALENSTPRVRFTPNI